MVCQGCGGCLVVRKFRFKVEWNRNFPEHPFGNWRLPLEIAHFFRSEGNHSLDVLVSSFPLAESNITRNLVLMVCWFWKNPYRYSTVGCSSWFIPKNAKHPLCHFGQVSNKNLPWSQRFSLIFLRMRALRESRKAVNTSREKNKNKSTSGTKMKKISDAFPKGTELK